jgi:hypothetical protein
MIDAHGIVVLKDGKKVWWKDISPDFRLLSRDW